MDGKTDLQRSYDEHRPLLRAMLGFNRLLMRVYHRVEIHSSCPVPRNGAAILACNHINSVDPAFLQSVCNRPIAWMMAREYMTTPGAGWLFRLLGVIPVERSGRDLSSTRLAMRALADGRVLGIFPEGRLSEGDLLPFQSGVILLAAKMRVPIIPAFIDGTYRKRDMLSAYMLSNVAHIAFGEPMLCSPDDASSANIDKTTESLRIRILKLGELMRGQIRNKL